MKTILVTGGAGFVGSHACKALSRAGYLPVTFDNLERGHERAVKWGPLERGDLRNEQRPPASIRGTPALGRHALCSLCLCRRIDGRTGEILRQQYRRDGEAAPGLRDVRLQELRVLELLRDLWHSRAPASDGGGCPEPGQPVWLHQARGRAHAERCRGRAMASATWRCATSMRPAPIPTAISASCICPKPTSFRSSCSRRWGAQPSIKIFGSDYPTPDGTCIRDYVHVSDLADAHVAASTGWRTGNPSESFNLGNGRGFSVAEVVRTAEKVTGAPGARPKSCRGVQATLRYWSATPAKPASCWAGRRTSRNWTSRSRMRGHGSATRRRMSE